MRRLLQFLAICTVVHSVFFTGAGAAAQCAPVAYLFRHAEDKNQDKQHLYDVTLTESGLAHAGLYVPTITTFQQEKPGYCPIKVVYALNPENFDGSFGTSNPYWTAYPLAQAVQTNTDDSTLEDTNPIISVQGLKLTEYLDHGEGEQFVEAIKGTLNNQQSVAIFWTSQGMCEVAKRLGQPDIHYNCVTSKPPRNSVFRFNYDVLGEQFTSVTLKYAQCFNYNATTDSFTNDMYYCQFSANLADWEGPEYPGFSDNLQKISGRICDKDNPDPTCIP
jgi:hypothetical protein